MKSVYTRIISVFLSFSILFFSFLPVVFAADYKSRANIWNWLVGNNSFLRGVVGYSTGQVCPSSNDGYHHSSYPLGFSGGDRGSLDGSVSCRCTYCGSDFTGYPSDLQQSYDDQISDLPISGIDSDGGLIWTLDHDYFELRFKGGSIYCSHSDLISENSTSYNSSVLFDCANGHITVTDYNITGVYFYYSGSVPITGSYVRLVSPSYSVLWLSGTFYDTSWNWQSQGTQSLLAGQPFSVRDWNNSPYGFTTGTYFSGFYYPPMYRVTPLSDFDSDTWNKYDPSGRPGTITGPLGTSDDDGDTVSPLDIDSLFDEYTKKFYDYQKKLYRDIEKWFYDYTKRQYQLQTSDGDNIYVTYGDEYITVQEGDTIYNIYYIIDSGIGGGDPADPIDPDPGPGGDPTPDDSPWHEKIYNKLCDILDAIFGLELSQDVQVDVDVTVDGDGELDQEGFFAQLVSKFGWISQLSKIFSQLVADVTSDASSAAAVSDGTVTVGALSYGHAVPAARASPLDDSAQVYTAPQLNITLGSSDAYDVDWENVKVIDLSWYAQYKSTIDAIISGFLWLGYVYLLVKRAPEIIKGSGMVSERLDRYD